MKWYTGGIAAAVQQSHATKALFCVAILGTDEESANLLSSLEAVEVQALIMNEGFVFIRLETNSQEHVQFSQLYPNANGASIYCITNNGTPVEIISGSSDSTGLLSRFGLAVQRHRELQSAKPAVVASGSSSSQITNTNTVVSSEPEPILSPQVNISSTAPDSSSQEPAATEPQVPLEERIERAKRLAAAKQQKKLAEEAEEAKKREFERREAGRGASELKRWQDDQAAKKLVEERRKDKQDEAALRKRIKEQIAQDRIDRQARVDREAGLVTEDVPNPNTTKFRHQAQVSTNFSGQARLQFRLPDGSTQSSAFDPESTLGSVRQYLVDNSIVPQRDFSIWVAFPRREFTAADYGTSLRDLGLLPSAALLIIPVADRSILSNAGNAGEGLMNLVYVVLGYLLLPINFIMAFFRPAIQPAPSKPSENRRPGESSRPNPRGQQRSMGTGNVLGGSSQQASPSSSSSKKESSSDGSSSAPAEKRAKSSGSKTADNFGVPEGNVHRLRTSETDSDEEKATWNGNSTQQM